MKQGTLHVEYLVVGSITLLAFATSFPPSALENASDLGLKLLALIPLLYISGMLIDSLGVIAEEGLRRLTGDNSLITKFRERGAGREEEVAETISRTVEIIHWNSDVGEALRLRRARDRIARGTVIALIVLVFISHEDHARNGFIAPAIEGTIFESGVWRKVFWGVLILWTGVIWYWMHNLTRDFKRKAYVLASKRQISGSDPTT